MTVKTEPANLEEYKALRDETMKRIEARNQTLSYTLVFAASMFTLALGTNGYTAALLVYPLVAFFFSTGFAFNSLMLIEIGSYMRSLEKGATSLGWATHLRDRYPKIEIFELVSSVGLFVGTEAISLTLYLAISPVRQPESELPLDLAWCALAGTVFMAMFPWFYHRRVLRPGS